MSFFNTSHKFEPVISFSPNSLHYLLGLWQRLTASIPYIRNSKAHELEKYTPEVTKSFVQSRLECAKLVLFEGMDNPLEDINSIVQQLDRVANNIQLKILNSHLVVYDSVIGPFDAVC